MNPFSPPFIAPHVPNALALDVHPDVWEGGTLHRTDADIWAFYPWQTHGDVLAPPEPASQAASASRDDGGPIRRKRKLWRVRFRERPLLKVAKYFQRVFNGHHSDEHAALQQQIHDNNDPHAEKRVITPEEWCQYGQWARPRIGCTYVRNRTPKSTPQEWTPSTGIPDLAGPNGSPHPERWIPGLVHPNIPPRPSAWHTPRSDEPIPLPIDTQLNPLLVHTRAGWPPVTFFINLPAVRIMYEGMRHEYDCLIPVPDEDYAQPATHPLVTDFVISAVADDTSPRLPWPVHVRNPRGINVGDVFDAIFESFQAHMTPDELDALSPRRRDQIQRSYWARVTAPANGGVVPGESDGVRRIDYFVDRILFRGLEPSPHGDNSWMMFLGPP